MMLVLGIPDEADGGQAERALAAMQQFKELAFPTGHGKYAKTRITFVYVTDATGRCDQHNEE